MIPMMGKSILIILKKTYIKMKTERKMMTIRVHKGKIIDKITSISSPGPGSPGIFTQFSRLSPFDGIVEI